MCKISIFHIHCQKLVSATGFYFIFLKKGNCNISQFRLFYITIHTTHNFKFLKRLHCKKEMWKWKSKFWCNNFCSMAETKWVLKMSIWLSSEITLKPLQYAWDGFEHHCVWVSNHLFKGTSVVLVQHQFKCCFAEVKNDVGFVIKTVVLLFSSECFNFGANVHGVRAFAYL